MSSNSKPSWWTKTHFPKERRALIQVSEFQKGVAVLAEAKKRATVLDEVLAYTDDGRVFHVPTARGIPLPDGAKDLRAFVLWLLHANAMAWDESRKLKPLAVPGEPLRSILREVCASYPGD